VTKEQRAIKAKELKENPLLPEVFKAVEENCFSSWRIANTVEMRETHWALMKALTLIRSELDVTIKRALGDEQR
jgi:hypothetical protein